MSGILDDETNNLAAGEIHRCGDVLRRRRINGIPRASVNGARARLPPGGEVDRGASIVDGDSSTRLDSRLRR